MEQVYKSAWVSSIEHMNQFGTYFADKKAIKKANVPKVRMLFDYVPVVMFSKGNIQLRPDGFSYQAVKHKNNLFVSYLNLDDQLDFTVNYAEIAAVDRYQHPTPMMQYSAKWLRVKTKDGRELLFTAGGRTMGQINKKTDELFEALQAKVHVNSH